MEKFGLSKISLSDKKLNVLAIISVAIFAVACFWKLGSYGLADWDEAIYAEVARNVLHGHFFTLYWNGADWFQKPPLALWLEAGAFKLFAVNEFSARFVSAISGVVLAWVTYIFSKRLFKAKIAILSLLLFVSDTFLLFYSRFGTTDMLVACLTVTGLYFFWLSQEEKKYLYPFFLLIGFAVMTKGPAGLSPLLIVVVYLLLTRQFLTYIKNIHTWIGLLLMLTIALPWHIYMLEKFGLGFWSQYYDYQIVLRSKVAIEGHIAPWYYYLENILKYYPITIFLPLFFLVWKEAVRKYSQPIIFVACWLIIQFITIQSVATRIEWYILPVHIPLIIALAVIIFYLISKNSFFIYPVVFFFLATILLPAYIPTRWREIKLYETNKACLLSYENLAKDQNSQYYFAGFYPPTVLFYLQPKTVDYNFSDQKELPPGYKALIRADKNLPEGTSLVSDIGCKVVE